MHRIRSLTPCRARNAFCVERFIDALLSPTAQAVYQRQRSLASCASRHNTAASQRVSSTHPDSSNAPSYGSSGLSGTDGKGDQSVISTDTNAVPEWQTTHPEIGGVPTGSDPSSIADKRERIERARQKRKVARVIRETPAKDLHDPSSLERTIDLHRQAIGRPTIRNIKHEGNAAIKRPEFINKQRRDRMSRKGIERKMELDRLMAEDPLLGSDPMLNDHFNRHLKLEVQAAGGDKAALITAIKKDLSVRQVKQKAGKPYKIGVSDYEGRYVLPIKQEHVEMDSLPWVAGIEDRNTSMAEQLSAEIRLFYKYIQSTPREQEVRRAATEDILEHLARILPGKKAEIFGSQRTGICVATSDIDIRIFDEAQEKDLEQMKAPRWKVRDENLKALQSILAWQDQNPKNSIFMLPRLRHSRYPLISTIHRKSGLDVQLVCSNDTGKSREMMKAFLAADLELLPLFITIKALHEARGLLDVFRGGLGSYTLFMMVVASTKLAHPGQNRSKGSTVKSLGDKFLNFLEFWATLDAHKYGVSVEPPMLFEKRHVGWRITKKEREAMANDETLRGLNTISIIDAVEPYLLCLQDPADPLNDLGAKSFGINHIRATYGRLYENLMAKEQQGTSAGDHDHRAKSCLIAESVANAYSAIKERREQMIALAEGQDVDILSSRNEST